MRRALITGVTGFVGRHLAAALSQADVAVHGLSRSAAAADLSPLPVTPHACDLTKPDGLGSLLADIEPDHIYHLAGYAHVGKSFAEPRAAWAMNFEATRNLFDAVLAWGGRPRVLAVSTGLVYGEADGPCAEETPLAPRSPYAAGKAAAEMLAYQLTCEPGLEVIRARPFNHVGPGQSADYALPNFARQVVAIEAGEQPPVIRTGDLSGRRDLCDVRDTVRAYVMLMRSGKPGGAYNVGAGRSWRMDEVLDRLIELTSVRAEVVQKADPARRADTKCASADTAKLRAATGWSPQYDLGRTLTDLLDSWRAAGRRPRTA